MADEMLKEFWEVLKFFHSSNYFVTLRRTNQHLAKRETVAFPTASVQNIVVKHCLVFEKVILKYDYLSWQWLSLHC